ncbi:MAG: PD-(D/E)XK nuclease family protein [Smithella sp.]
MKAAAHPQQQSRIITFEPRYHTYQDNHGQKYLSGTQLLKKFTPKFDAVAVSEKCAAGKNPKYKGRSPEEIRQEWKSEGDRGRSEGENFHAYVEARLFNLPAPKPISERCEKLFVQGDDALRKLQKRFMFIDAEMMVFSPELGIAGQIDLVMFDQNTNEMIVLDWKQNREIDTENNYQNLLPPIDHLQSAALHQYTLQLSLYQFLLEREGYFNVAGYRRALIHITPETNKAIPLDDYRYEIMEMLKYEGRL